MADLRISQLPLTTSPSLSDIVPVVNQGSTKKLSLQQLQTFLGTSSYLTTTTNPLLINTNYFISVSSSSQSVTMPPNPPAGAVVNFVVLVNDQTLTLNRNNQRFNGSPENLVIDYSAAVSLVYTGQPGFGWLVSNVFEI